MPTIILANTPSAFHPIEDWQAYLADLETCPADTVNIDDYLTEARNAIAAIERGELPE